MKCFWLISSLPQKHFKWEAKHKQKSVKCYICAPVKNWGHDVQLVFLGLNSFHPSACLILANTCVCMLLFQHHDGPQTLKLRNWQLFMIFGHWGEPNSNQYPGESRNLHRWKSVKICLKSICCCLWGREKHVCVQKPQTQSCKHTWMRGSHLFSTLFKAL